MPLHPSDVRPALPAISLLAISLLVLSGCASAPGSRTTLQAGADLPEHFLVQESDGGTRAAQAGEGCRNPLVDPRNQARLILQQSRDGWGDYQLPAGQYQSRQGQWLRVECATGKPLGLVQAD